MKILFKLIIAITFFGLLAGCSEFPVYKPTIQQGNVFTSEMTRQLRIGMSPEQVRYIMGSPVLTHTFNPDRWNYVYVLQRGNKQLSEKIITIYFANGHAVKIQ
jgi:outer membrane protein assembly factor BamE